MFTKFRSPATFLVVASFLFLALATTASANIDFQIPIPNLSLFSFYNPLSKPPQPPHQPPGHHQQSPQKPVKLLPNPQYLKHQLNSYLRKKPQPNHNRERLIKQQQQQELKLHHQKLHQLKLQQLKLQQTVHHLKEQQKLHHQLNLQQQHHHHLDKPLLGEEQKQGPIYLLDHHASSVKFYYHENFLGHGKHVGIHHEGECQEVPRNQWHQRPKSLWAKHCISIYQNGHCKGEGIQVAGMVGDLRSSGMPYGITSFKPCEKNIRIRFQISDKHSHHSHHHH